MKKNLKKIGDKILQLEIEIRETKDSENKKKLIKEVQKVSASACLLGIEAISQIDQYVFSRLYRSEKDNEK